MKTSHYYKILIFFLFLSVHTAFSQSSDADVAELRESVVAEAKKYVGVPYLWGGTTAAGMDCSGFIYTVVADAAKVQLPRTVITMYSFTRLVSADKKEIGDILFFNTVGSNVSHAGIYIGNNQFIHSASAGSNTGVIVSSLNQSVWQEAYVGCGQYLPASNTTESEQYANSSDTSNNSNSAQSTGNSFLENVSFDFSATMIWNFFDTDSIMFNARGATVQAHAKYIKWDVQPGFGVELRFDPRMDIVQIPLHFSVSVPLGFKFYAGPVFTIGTPHLIGNEKEVSASIFPGIMGVSWQSPGLSVGKTELAFMQDIAWTVFNETDNSALNIKESFVAGFVFSTGIRVTLPGSQLIK